MGHILQRSFKRAPSHQHNHTRVPTDGKKKRSIPCGDDPQFFLHVVRCFERAVTLPPCTIPGFDPPPWGWVYQTVVDRCIIHGSRRTVPFPTNQESHRVQSHAAAASPKKLSRPSPDFPLGRNSLPPAANPKLARLTGTITLPSGVSTGSPGGVHVHHHFHAFHSGLHQTWMG